MWGTLLSIIVISSERRFIPTHVGNTSQCFIHLDQRPVHPHACGEHARKHLFHTFCIGSSPRMWGTRLVPEGLDYVTRFIPTHVGNTSPNCFLMSGRTVHPHACGEHSIHKPAQGMNLGSSPRMWGTHETSESLLQQFRFIPTHVGNTINNTSGFKLRTVHPHACGEHVKPHCQKLWEHGSSPRMWGTRPATTTRHWRQRFIPTHVGNTVVPIERLTMRAVHPHACGEHPVILKVTSLVTGSSPRMWGTPSNAG